MLCQNCGKNEATVHLKRIVNGSAAEVHLCADCAFSLGYGDAFSGFGFGTGGLFSDLFLKGENAAQLRCPGCGKTLDEIISGGLLGCAECYNTFYDKLVPTLRRLHGNSVHVGKRPNRLQSDRTAQLRRQLEDAVARQDFELAAQLRDEIGELTANGGDAQ